MLKIFNIFFIYAVCWPVLAGNGTAGYEFLRTDFSPRSSAMAGSFYAMRGDINGILHNPAGPGFLQDDQFAFNYARYFLDMNTQFAGYSHFFAGIGQLSAVIAYFDYGSFDETNQYAEKTGRTYSAADMAFTISIANKLENLLTYGVSAKFIHSKIDNYTANAYAFDFGLIYEVPLQQDLFIGISLLNLGQTTDTYVSREERLPLSLRFGVSKKLAHLPLEINLGLNDINQQEDEFTDYLQKFSIGGEFTLSEMLRLRLGYNNDVNRNLETTTSTSGFAGVSLGGGIVWRKYRLDYAASSFGDLGTIHRFGISGIL